MTKPTSFHDVELISAYLDGQLSGTEKAQIELRLKNEPELRSLQDQIGASRAILHKLPARRAPRNFTLTPRMAGVKPPLPRAFPAFRWASAVAAFLFFMALAANLSVPALANLRASAPPVAFGMGGGGGGVGGGAPDIIQPTPMEAAPAAPQAAAPAPTATPEVALLAPAATPAPTQAAETPLQPGAQSKVLPTPESQQPPAAQARTPLQLPIPAWLQFGLLGLAVIAGGAAYLLNRRAQTDWSKTQALKPARLGLWEALLILLALIVIAALAAGIYYLSTTTFLAPLPRTETFPSGPAGGDKGGPLAGNKGPVAPGAEFAGPTVSGAGNKGGNKGGGASVGAQAFTLSQGLGYNFSATDAAGLITAVEFPPDVFPGQMLVTYIPGLTTAPPQITYFDKFAFSLVPENKNAQPEKPFNLVVDYSQEVAAAVKPEKLAIFWWNGSTWLDAAGTCHPTSDYVRSPQVNRLNLMVCQLGSFILVATP